MVPAPFPDTSLGKKLPSHRSPLGCCVLLSTCPAAASSQGAHQGTSKKGMLQFLGRYQLSLRTGKKNEGYRLGTS